MIEIDDKLCKTAFNEVAATDAGKVLLAAIMIDCRWNTTIVSSENPQVTQFYAAQRGVYGAIREHIKPEHLKEIEFNYRSKPHDNGTRDTTRTNPSARKRSTNKPSDRK